MRSGPHVLFRVLTPAALGTKASFFSAEFERRWTTEDPVLFRISINTFLDQLSLVMRNIQRLEFVAVVKRGRGRSRES
ncbi:hypothetical protein I79_022993 [Cricetulus griseus]|uniref:Uncharacterized protein n=1 Tax=Cricetulus griseus TaxID=10029 RepID=G3IP51_CRIGR|nr:hypothetical protein I79_025754 [Cricetulus griseus]EGW12038.1 hypothetical protein I79_022993 [Cricetulus griseus]